jgi:hypothetical protein
MSEQLASSTKIERRVVQSTNQVRILLIQQFSGRIEVVVSNRIKLFSSPLFASLRTVPLLTVFCLHAFPCNYSYSQCNRKIAESLQTQALWAWHVWALRNIRIASLPSCCCLVSHGSASFAPPAA